MILAGNNEAAVRVLDLLVELTGSDQLWCLVPDHAQVGSWQADLGRFAEERRVPYRRVRDVNADDVVEAVHGFGPDLLISVYFTQLLGRTFLDALACPAVNLHPSLLPRHRGVAPLVWAIIDGDTRTGVSAHLIDDGVDTGPLLLQRMLPIHPDDTGAALHRKASRLAAAMAGELLRHLRDHGELPEARMQTGASTYRDRRHPLVNHLDWTDPAERIRNVVRALAPPLPGAYTYVGTHRVTLVRVEPLPARGQRPWQPGTLSLGRDGDPVVWAADGPVRVAQVDLNDGAGVQAGSALTGVEGAYEGVRLR